MDLETVPFRSIPFHQIRTRGRSISLTAAGGALLPILTTFTAIVDTSAILWVFDWLDQAIWMIGSSPQIISQASAALRLARLDIQDQSS